MTVDVIEQFVLGKYDEPSLCEDVVTVTPNHIAIFDGATAKNGFRWKGKTTGRLAAELAAKTVGGLAEESDLPGFLASVEEAFQAFYGSTGRTQISERNTSERLQAAGAVLSRFRREVWLVGDCQALVNGEAPAAAGRGVDEVMARARSLILESELVRGNTVEGLRELDVGREGIMHLLRRASDFANRTDSRFGYSVLDGFTVPLELVRVLRVPPGEVEVVLASDGYPLLRPTLEASEAELASILERDPLAFRDFPSTKGLTKGLVSMDDRAYVRVSLRA